MKEKAVAFLEQYVTKQDTLVVGVSGGVDSMVLLSIMVELRKKIPYLLVCAHVNHNVRKESKKEQKFVEEWCTKHDVLFETMTIASYGDDNFHNEARHVRYQYFADVIQKYQAKFLVTAHHGDDLMETILMRLVRGSTLRGYAGFSEVVSVDHYQILRPLIFFTKEEITTYARAYQIPFMEDRSNYKDKYTRNRYRKYVLPFLKQEDPHVHEKFYKFHTMMVEADRYLEKETAKAFQKVYHDHKLWIPSFLKLDHLLQVRVIYSLLEQIYEDDLMFISDRHVKMIEDCIRSRKANAYLYLPNLVKVVKCYDTLYIETAPKEIASYEIAFEDYAELPNGKHLERVAESDLNDNTICRLSRSDVVFPLYIRTRKHGDKMALKGSGHKKIKDIFIDCKIPPEERELWPIVVDSQDRVLWIPGLKKSKFNKQKNETCDIIIKYY